MAEIRQINVARPAAPLKGELPIDNDALFEKLMADPLVTGPDMMVEGNWTQHAIADFISMKEFTEGIKTDWDTFKQVRWNTLRRGQKLGTAHGFASFGKPSGLEASFDVGDPALGNVKVGYDYEIVGRSGSGASLVVNNTVVANVEEVKEEAERAVVFSAPNDVAIAQAINRGGWGYQLSTVGAILKSLPKLGASEEWRVPSYSPVSIIGGRRKALVAGYSFNYLLPMGIPAMRAVFDIKSSRSGTFTFAMRDSGGEVIASRDVDISEGDNQVAIVFTGVPASGMVSIDSLDTSYTITGTEVMPPIL